MKRLNFSVALLSISFCGCKPERKHPKSTKPCFKQRGFTYSKLFFRHIKPFALTSRLIITIHEKETVPNRPCLNSRALFFYENTPPNHDF